jgi:hypothetical protein
MNYRARLIFLFLAILTVLAAAGISAGGCGDVGTYIYPCREPALDHKDFAGRSDPCCNDSPCCPSPVLDHHAEDPIPAYDKDGNRISHMLWDPCCMVEDCPGVNVWLPPSADGDTGGAGGTSDAGSDAQASLCPGKCVDAPSDGWWMAALLWHGPPDQEPACPKSAPKEGYRGYADLAAPPVSCDACSCDPPAGECGLPSVLTASANVCSSAGILTPFNAPPSWDGSCTAQDAIPGGAQCNGSPCVKSLTIEPLTLRENGCTPHPNPHEVVPLLGPSWKTSALACQVSDYPPCSETQVCAPVADSRFLTCIFTWGDDHKCPEPYTEQHIFYDDYSDTRACADCTCDPPVGSVCTAELSVYKDAACANPVLQSYQIASTGQGCLNILPPGLPLGSKAITKPTYTPGSCQPGEGGQTGELALIGAATFCCLQS